MDENELKSIRKKVILENLKEIDNLLEDIIKEKVQNGDTNEKRFGESEIVKKLLSHNYLSPISKAELDKLHVAGFNAALGSLEYYQKVKKLLYECYPELKN